MTHPKIQKIQDIIRLFPDSQNFLLSLVYLHSIDYAFHKRRLEIIEDGWEDEVDNPIFYTAENIIYLPIECRWNYIISQPNLAKAASDAISKLKNDNTELNSIVFPIYDNTTIDRILNDIPELSNILKPVNIDNPERSDSWFIHDTVVDCFLDTMKYKDRIMATPSLELLIMELMSPIKSGAVVYDPSCGFGTMLMTLNEYNKKHKTKKDFIFYANYSDSKYSDWAQILLKAKNIDVQFLPPKINHCQEVYLPDYIINSHLYSSPKYSNACQWMIEALGLLDYNGKACLTLSSEFLWHYSKTMNLRKTVLPILDAVIKLPNRLGFICTSDVYIWVFNKQKLSRKRTKVMFMDISDRGDRFSGHRTTLSNEEIQEIAGLYKDWCKQGRKKMDLQWAKTVSSKEIASNDYSFDFCHYLPSVSIEHQ